MMGLAGSQEPVGTEEEINELAADRQGKMWGKHSDAWWKMYKSAGRHVGDVAWVAEMMPAFKSAFDSAFVVNGVVLQEFLTSTKAYISAFKGYISEVMGRFTEKTEEHGSGSTYAMIAKRLEWVLWNWPYNKGIPMPVITNRMMGWMEQRLKPIEAGIEVSLPIFLTIVSWSAENPIYCLTDDRGNVVLIVSWTMG
jgi:hypothetical protein